MYTPPSAWCVRNSHRPLTGLTRSRHAASPIQIRRYYDTSRLWLWYTSRPLILDDAIGVTIGETGGAWPVNNFFLFLEFASRRGGRCELSNSESWLTREELRKSSGTVHCIGESVALVWYRSQGHGSQVLLATYKLILLTRSIIAL